MSEPEAEDKAAAVEPTAGDENDTDVFSERAHHYLSLRAAEIVGGAVTGQLTEAARNLVFTPASAPWQILFKIELLQATHDFGGTWLDQRESAYLGAIRADVIRWM